MIDYSKILTRYSRLKCLNNTSSLKFLYRRVNQMIKLNQFESIVEFTNLFSEQYKDDVSGLRMLLDAVKKVSNEPIITPLMPKLIGLIEEKIGKKLH